MSCKNNEPSAATKIRLVQVNLKHKILAIENALINFNINNIDVALIQEPWIRHGKIMGFSSKDYKMFYKTSSAEDYRPRACILVKNNINAFLLPSFSDGDTTTVCLESSQGRIIVTSAYLAHELAAPTPSITRLMTDLEDEAILGLDANSRHTAWGSTSCNERGKSLFEFISSSDLSICNRGNTPTFEFPSTDIYPGWKDVIDVTLSKLRSKSISNWRVSNENSFSDHKFIYFELDFMKDNSPAYRNPRKTNWDEFDKIAGCKLKKLYRKISNSSSFSLDETVEELTNSLMRAFQVSCRVTRVRKNVLPSYFTAELKALRAETRKQFNRAYRSNSWDEYKRMEREYNKAKKEAKAAGWRNFCEEVESTKDTARLRKILSKSTTVPSFLQKECGEWAQSSEETNNLLLDTHFPGSKDASRAGVNYSNFNGQWDTIEQLLSVEKITWAINSFEPFKSPGVDGIIPKMLHVTAKKIAPILLEVYKKCLSTGSIPTLWRQVKVVFIPKAGKINHCKAKDYRPISLSSFLLKTLERILDEYLRGKFNPILISGSQHAYIKGKSTETALHEVVLTIEKSLEYSQFTLAAFLDIEGAFNNVTTEAIIGGLQSIGTDPTIANWITTALTSRVIHSKIGANSIRRSVVRGTPQGGVISPLLWLLVINKVLRELDSERLHVVAYADDLLLLSSGHCMTTISSRLQKSLKMVNKWANDCGLGVNPDKTELVLFTRKLKPANFKTPKLGGKSLTLSDKAKYLGVILDSRLNWKSNIEERIRKSQIAFYTCKSAIGKTWGLSPKLTYWIFTAVVRPILLYAVAVWWTASKVKENCRKLDGVQRMVGIGITGALKTTATDAILVLLGIPFVAHTAKSIAANTALRLLAIGQWKIRTYGHSNILAEFNIKMVDMDLCKDNLNFKRSYRVEIPPRTLWECNNTLEGFDIKIFTDGSKTDSGCGAGFHFQDSNIRRGYRLPNCCSVFQGEIYAILMACKELKIRTDLELLETQQRIVICVDSQAALKALESIHSTSIIVRDCKELLTKLSVSHDITLMWVPGHSNVEGNEMADLLARQGSSLHISWAEKIPAPLTHFKLIIKQQIYKAMCSYWKNSKAKSRYIWQDYDKKQSRLILGCKRRTIRRIIFAITGHITIGRHARRIGISPAPECPGCGLIAQETDLHHIWCMCPALCRKRMFHLGSYSFAELRDLENIPQQAKINFASSIGWLG